MDNGDNILSTFQWWKQRRKHYNLSLIVAGVLAFVCYCLVLWSNQDVILDAEITAFTTLFQGIGYLFMMGIANILFFAGPICESVVKPKNVSMFRVVAYRIGYWFSVLLPFSIPSLLLYLVEFHPCLWKQ